MKLAWKQIVVSLLIGLAAGAAAGRWAGLLRHGRWDDEKRYARMLERFNRELDLSPEQRDKVAAVLESKRLKVQALRAEVRPRFEELRRSAKDEIRALLRPEQKTAFEKLEARWAAKRQKMGQRL